MKKLLVIALAAMLVLGFAAIAMADPSVAINGEVAATFGWSSASGANGNTFYGRMNGDDQTNIKFTAALNDDVSAVIQIDFPTIWGQNVGNSNYLSGTLIPTLTPSGQNLPVNNAAYFDNTYIQVKNLYGGTLKVGKTGWESPGLTINMRNSTGFENDPGNDTDDSMINAAYVVPVADGLTVGVGYEMANPDASINTAWENCDGMAAVDINYTKDQLILDGFYNTWDTSYDILVGYKVTDAFVVKVMNGSNGDIFLYNGEKKSQYNNTGAELNYTIGAFNAVLEYDSWANGYAAANNVANSCEYLRLSYKFSNGFALQYDINNNSAGNNTYGNQLMAKVNF